MAEGKVYLVGAGPGDPGLLTLRGRECLLQADEVVYDGLVNPLLLRLTKAHATRTSRVDGPTGRRLDQEEINTLLIALAREGKCVVRLKGGDPYIFGRGAEEAEALLKAGIEFEVVPGVTAATAVTAYAGISLTHREDASAVAYVTGHEDPTKPHSALDYETLARFPGTLVFYMGLHRLPEITAALISAGLSPSTPAAVISRGATSRQRTVTASLESLPEKVTAARLRPPSLIVIGSCVMRHERLAWFEAKPLLGQRIGITRPDAQSEPQIARAIEPYQPFWYEDPIRMNSPQALAEYAAATDIWVCASETLGSRFPYKDMLDRGATHIAMVDLCWTGGLTEGRKIAALADTYHRPFAPHDCTGPVGFVAAIHASFSQPNTLIQESVRAFYDGWYRELVTEMPVIRDGHALPMQGPGLGTELLPAVFERGDLTTRRTELDG